MGSYSLYRPVRIGKLELPGNLFLAPVAGYTDRVFRSICAEYGADFSFTELASSEALMRGGKPSFNLIRRGEKKRPPPSPGTSSRDHYRRSESRNVFHFPLAGLN